MGNKIVQSVSIDSDVVTRMREAAKRDKRSLSSWLEIAAEEQLERQNVIAETPDEPKKAAPEGTGTGAARDARSSRLYSDRSKTKDVKPRGSSRRKKP